MHLNRAKLYFFKLWSLARDPDFDTVMVYERQHVSLDLELGLPIIWTFPRATGPLVLLPIEIKFYSLLGTLL